MKIKQIVLVTILALGQLLCFGQTFQTKKELGRFELKSKQDSRFYALKTDKSQEFDPSQGIIIENSFPKGGGYADSTGKQFGYRIFWYRVINKTPTPLELTINFPASATHPFPDYSLKLFLPPDTMTLSKEILYAYGVTDLESLDTYLNKPTMLQRTVNPEAECFFYIGALIQAGAGIVRAELVFEEQDLFYKITGVSPELDSALIPCGHIIAKK